MSTSPFLIYVVDDEPIILDMIAGTLEDIGEIRCFDSAKDCLAACKTQTPDMFILDIKMPEMDGYTLCQQLKSQAETQNIPVTFLSAHNDIESRLHAYEAGGQDFIVKPFEPDELRLKVRIAQQILQAEADLRAQAGSAQKIAFSAMSSMGELGVVLNFLRNSFSCPDSKQMGLSLLSAIGQYDLVGAVQVRMNGEEINISNEGTNLPLESSVLNHVRDQGRIFEFGPRGVYNFEHITLLVKNMPRHDAELCGRLRDHLALLAEGADARCERLAHEKIEKAQAHALSQAAQDIKSAINEIQQKHKTSQAESSVTMSVMEQHIEKTFLGMGLTEGQEEALIASIQPHFQTLREGLDANLSVTQKLQALANQLEQITAQSRT